MEDFIKKRPNDRIGMVAFAVNPFLVSPNDAEPRLASAKLERLDIGVIDPNRTAIGSAIGMSVNRLRDLKNAKSRVIILLTDGENNA
ncbi:MAG: VWA domain-containing protein [Bacilli bacterium]